MLLFQTKQGRLYDPINWVDDLVSIATSDHCNDPTGAQGTFRSYVLRTTKLTARDEDHSNVPYDHLSQAHYIDMLLKKSRLTDANPASTPMNLGTKLDPPAKESPDGGRMRGYDISHGSLVGTRPDIAFAVNNSHNSHPIQRGHTGLLSNVHSGTSSTLATTYSLTAATTRSSQPILISSATQTGLPTQLIAS